MAGNSYKSGFVALIGRPNVGKSTLISAVSNARPKIANYHFTTLNPNLGVIDLGGGNSFIMADIPGLIEGAAEGAGLGHDFLRHIERTKILLHVVDAAGTEGRDPVEDIRVMMDELRRYNEDLLKKPMLIAANKTDVIMDDGTDPVQRIREAFPDIPVYLTYAEPYFRLRAGDFRNRVEAEKCLRRIKPLFREAFVTSDIIYQPKIQQKTEE